MTTSKPLCPTTLAFPHTHRRRSDPILPLSLPLKAENWRSHSEPPCRVCASHTEQRGGIKVQQSRLHRAACTDTASAVSLHRRSGTDRLCTDWSDFWLLTIMFNRVRVNFIFRQTTSHIIQSVVINVVLKKKQTCVYKCHIEQNRRIEQMFLWKRKNRIIEEINLKSLPVNNHSCKQQ